MNFSDQPKVSVIIPTFKRSEFLVRAIDSVLSNSYPNIEIIIVDDNFHDSDYRIQTKSIMEKYSNNPNVMYLLNPLHTGGALSRNEGIKIAKGDYITFLDDDDIYLPDKIKSQVIFMEEHDYEMCFTDLRLHDPSDKLVDYREYSFITDFSPQSLLRYHLTRHITGTPTFMYKTSYLKEIGGFSDTKVSQEFYLMLKTIENGAKIGYLPQSQTIAYLHSNEKVSTGRDKVDGEKALFAFKKKYFTQLTIREKIFIRFRYHIVMAVVGIRNKDNIFASLHALTAFFLSPVDTFIESYRFIHKLRRTRYISK